MLNQSKNWPCADYALLLEHSISPHHLPQGGLHGPQCISPLWPPLPGKTIKAKPFYSPKTLSLCFYLSPVNRGQVLTTLFGWIIFIIILGWSLHLFNEYFISLPLALWEIVTRYSIHNYHVLTIPVWDGDSVNLGLLNDLCEQPFCWPTLDM